MSGAVTDRSGMPDYDAGDDAAKSYEVAIADKLARGDGHCWEARAAASDPLAHMLERVRIAYTGELDLQDKIAGLLKGWHYKFEREVRLSPKERIDFVVDDHVGIEVKIKGSKRDIYRQLERYAEFEQLHRLMLLSSVALGLPASIKGKPVTFVSLGSAWL